VQYAFLSSVFSFTGRLVGAISGVGGGEIRFRQLLRDHVFTFAAGLSAVAVGQTVDSGRPARVNALRPEFK
jgi:hypothetical protein